MFAGKKHTESSFVELLVRMGTPAEELVRVAGERGLDLLVLVSSPHSYLGPKQEIKAHTAREKQPF